MELLDPAHNDVRSTEKKPKELKRGRLCRALMIRAAKITSLEEASLPGFVLLLIQWSKDSLFNQKVILP